MEKEMQAIASRLVPDYDYIFNLYDFSMIWLSKRIENEAKIKFGDTALPTLFSLLDMPKELVHKIVIDVPETGTREIELNLHSGKFKVKTQYSTFDFRGEPFRVGRFLETNAL